MAKTRGAGLKHKFQTNFSGGVLSENAFGRIDISKYDHGLKVGKNIIIENPGGATKRPGTLFIKEYAEDYVRLFPFSFNADQTYLIVMTDQKVDIYKDDIQQATLVTPYLKDEITDIDWAQSADSMVLTHGNHPVQLLRRLGDDISWELVPLPFIEEPTQLICSNGEKPLPNGTCNDLSTPTPTPVWDAIQGYPKFCTFHGGRLFFSTTKTLPQNIWGSVIQDFFNFDVGTGEDSDAIYDALDTDFINPIVALYSEKKLFAFTTGSEFANIAQVITPASSSWKRQSENGSYGTVPPVTFDNGILYLDRSGRTIRQLLYTDGIEGYSSDSISMFSEHLIRTPVAMGVMKGRLFQASNFLYIVNSDGTIAVLNMSRATGMAAWTQWTTQGSYKDILSFSDEVAYVLVERRGKWILERMADGIYVDSGSVKETLTSNSPLTIPYLQNIPGINTGAFDAVRPKIQNNPTAIVGDDDNFFGISFNIEGKGRIVIVIGGVVVYKIDWFKDDPKEAVNVFGTIYIPINQFDESQAIEDLYFNKVPQTEFYQYSMITDILTDSGQNFIGGLPHLIGREVVTNLDGNVFRNQLVVQGDELPGGGLLKSYPDGDSWLFDEAPGNETYIRRFVDENNVTLTIEGLYQGLLYTPLTLNEFWNAYPITQSGEPVLNDEFLEEGVFVEEDISGNVIIDYNGISGDYPETVAGSNGNFIFTPLIENMEISVCICSGGGSGTVVGNTGSTGAYGGHSSQTLSSTFIVSKSSPVSFTLGLGAEGYFSDTQTIFGSDGFPSNFLSLSPAVGTGSNANSYRGDGENAPLLCAGQFKNGRNGQVVGVLPVYGGQGSSMGDGGNGWESGVPPDRLTVDGKAGAGGGSTFRSLSGFGGGGRCIISWKISVRRHRIRKMKLTTAAVPLTDGVVPTSRSYNIGQAGLWFNVQMETLPFDAASITNEPKRIVSVMPRFVKTVGLTVANTLVPGRNFGHEVLGRAPEKKSGIQKIRLIGYTRETTIRISQNDPLPMTLISLDIELKL